MKNLREQEKKEKPLSRVERSRIWKNNLYQAQKYLESQPLELQGLVSDCIVNTENILQAKEEFDKIVTKYNQLCVDLDLEYLWSVLKINGKIVFTTSTSPDKNTDNQK